MQIDKDLKDAISFSIEEVKQGNVNYLCLPDEPKDLIDEYVKGELGYTRNP